MNKTFYCSNLAYYAKALNKDQETMICMDLEDDEYYGEFAIRWIELGGESIPKIEAYDDSWKALFSAPDLIEYLTKVNNKDVTQVELVNALISLGFTDRTSYIPLEDETEKTSLEISREKLQSEITRIDIKLEKL